MTLLLMCASPIVCFSFCRWLLEICLWTRLWLPHSRHCRQTGSGLPGVRLNTLTIWLDRFTFCQRIARLMYYSRNALLIIATSCFSINGHNNHHNIIIVKNQWALNAVMRFPSVLAHNNNWTSMSDNQIIQLTSIPYALPMQCQN